MGLHIYVVIENGDPYPLAYMNYTAAVDAVKLKHKEAIEEELKENEGFPGCNEVDVPEAAQGPSRLYIEKGIHIEIHKLPVT